MSCPIAHIRLSSFTFRLLRINLKIINMLMKDHLGKGPPLHHKHSVLTPMMTPYEPCVDGTVLNIKVRSSCGSDTDKLKAHRPSAERSFPLINMKGAKLDFPKTIITVTVTIQHLQAPRPAGSQGHRKNFHKTQECRGYIFLNFKSSIKKKNRFGKVKPCPSLA